MPIVSQATVSQQQQWLGILQQQQQQQQQAQQQQQQQQNMFQQPQVSPFSQMNAMRRGQVQATVSQQNQAVSGIYKFV